MQECKHKRKINATIVDCCTEGNVLSNNIDKFYQIESKAYTFSKYRIFLLKESELALIFIKDK